jgi:hypothetical protein
MLSVVVRGLGVWSPGLEGWAAARAVLRGEAAYVPAPSAPPPPAILAPTERRRTGPVVRLALAVAQEAAAGSGLDPASLRSVFGSSNGDGVVVGGILDALARGAPEERVVSPTQFHNSVHNAAAGYWSIAHGGRTPATCLGAHDWTWAASLLKAAVEVRATGQAVLLACYDHPLPPPLDALRPTVAAFGAGMVLAPDGPGVALALSLRPGEAAEEGPALPDGLGALVAGNAAARALPLLSALARGEGGVVRTVYLDGSLDVAVTP